MIPSPTELQHNLARLIPTANLLEIPDPSLPCESPSLHPAHSLANTPNTPSLLQPGPTLNLPSFSPEWERRAARSKGGDERFSFPFGFFAFWIFHATPATQRKTGKSAKIWEVAGARKGIRSDLCSRALSRSKFRNSQQEKKLTYRQMRKFKASSSASYTTEGT